MPKKEPGLAAGEQRGSGASVAELYTPFDIPNSLSRCIAAPDLVAAQLYFDLLHEDDPTEVCALWTDVAARPLPQGWDKRKSLRSDQPDLLTQLWELNSFGYDIFAVVNRVCPERLATGKPTKDLHIRGIKALWIDLDNEPQGGELTNLGRLELLPHPPSHIVQTSQAHRLQAYWLLSDELSLEEGLALNRALAQKLGGDMSATNLSRMLRVPGFLHHRSGLYSQTVGGSDFHHDSKFLKGGLGVKEKSQPRKVGGVVSVSDESTAVGDALNEEEKKRRSKMQKTHAKERARDKRISSIERTRTPSLRLPPKVGQQLRSCETREEFIQTILDVWPRRSGHRHELALAVATDLFKFSVSLYEAKNIIREACTVANDDQVDDRLRAVADTYRRIEQGAPVSGVGSGAPMTVFSAEHWGPDLRELPSKERPHEARRRVLAALDDIQESSAGVKSCACRTLAERTGVGKNTVSQVLIKLEAEGRIKRVQGGVVVAPTKCPQKLPEAPQPATTDIHDEPAYERAYAPLQSAHSPSDSW